MNDDKQTLSKDQISKQKRRFAVTILLLCLLSIAVFAISVSVGRAGIKNPISVIVAFFLNEEGSTQMMNIFMNIRIPRACAAFLVGACLAASGTVYQTTFNNKLVSPDILGVGSGCCVGAGIAILLGMPAVMVRTMAFVFGFIAVAIAIALPKLFHNHSALTLVLSGIIVGSFMDSVLALIKYMADKQDKLADIIFWIMGSLVGIQIDEVLYSLAVSIIPFAILMLMAWRVNVISLGVEEAQSLGINYRFTG